MPSDRPGLSSGKRLQLKTDIIKAARKGKNAEILRLIKEGADIAAKDEKGLTPLHWAARGGWNETCILLIEEYAKANGNVKELIDAEDPERRTPRWLAKSWWNDQTVRLLDSMPQLQDWMGKENLRRFLTNFRECLSS